MLGEKLMRRLGRGATIILASAILTACAYGQGISWNGANTSSPAMGRSYLPSFEEVIDSFAPSARAAPDPPAVDSSIRGVSASGWPSGPNPLQSAQKTDQPGSSALNSSRLNFLNRLKRRLLRP